MTTETAVVTRRRPALPHGVLVLLLGLLPLATEAQEFPHPRDMSLAGARFQLRDTTQFQFQLANGLPGFAVADLKVPLVQFSAFVRVGWGDDRHQGAAEMLEAMMRLGPCWMGPDGFEQAMDRMAGELTVRMTAEMTEITLNVPAEDAGQGMRIFSGIVREPCIDRQSLEAFRRTGVTPALAVDGRDAEASMVNASMPVAVDLFNRRLFDGHPFSDVVTAEALAELTVEDVEEFFREYFTPTNTVLAVAGLFETQRILRDVDQRFADWQVRAPPRLQAAPDIETGPRDTYRYPADKLQSWIVIGHELPRMRPRDLPALQVMNYILGGGHFDTRLYRETRDKKGLTNDASGFLDINLRGPGSYTFRTSGRHEVVDELVAITLREIERIQNELVTEEELFVAKGALIDGDFSMRFENGYSTARTFAEEYAKYGTFEHLVRYPERVDDVSADDVRRAARRYLHLDRMAVVIVGS